METQFAVKAVDYQVIFPILLSFDVIIALVSLMIVITIFDSTFLKPFLHSTAEIGIRKISS